MQISQNITMSCTGLETKEKAEEVVASITDFLSHENQEIYRDSADIVDTKIRQSVTERYVITCTLVPGAVSLGLMLKRIREKTGLRFDNVGRPGFCLSF